jgi:NitT/TauT family transport system ATP-binding protein
VFCELDVDVPTPRSEAFRISPEYSSYCRRASEALQAAIGAAS